MYRTTDEAMYYIHNVPGSRLKSLSFDCLIGLEQLVLCPVQLGFTIGVTFTSGSALDAGESKDSLTLAKCDFQPMCDSHVASQLSLRGRFTFAGASRWHFASTAVDKTRDMREG
jgi:hypothetical protein